MKGYRIRRSALWDIAGQATVMALQIRFWRAYEAPWPVAIFVAGMVTACVRLMAETAWEILVECAPSIHRWLFEEVAE